MPNGGIEDEDGELEVWSNLKLNYGLISSPGRSKSLLYNSEGKNEEKERKRKKIVFLCQLL